MATWALTTFTTPADLAKIEEEIARFTSLGTKTYTAQALAVVSTSTGIDISGGKGVFEVIGSVNTGGAVTDLSISIQHSDDNITYEEIHDGQRVYYKSGLVTHTTGSVLFRWVVPSDSKDYINAIFTSSIADAAFKLDIYIVTRWNDKIELAKAFMGDDLELMLINAGLDSNMDYSDGDILLDVINNKSIFDYCSHYLTLSLIFEDLMTSGDENDIFRLKADRYYKRYKDKLDITFRLKNIDEDQDGTVDDYKEESIITHRLVR